MQNHVVLFYPRFNTEPSSGPPKDIRLPMSVLFLADPPRSKQFTPISLPYDLLNLSAYPANRVKVFLYHPIPGTVLYEYERDRHLIEYPKTLEQWAKIHAHANQPWYSATSLLLTYRNRDYVRKKSFYFWLTHLSPFLRSRKQTSRLKYLYELIYRIDKYRHEQDAFSLPVEELLYKYLYPLILLRRRGFHRTR